MHYSTKNNVIPHNQFGSLEKHSTIHAIHKVMDEINHHLSKGEIAGAYLIDIQRAFDSVWINGLIYILFKVSFPLQLIQLIWHLTTNRKFKTWNGDNFSTQMFDIVEGLMQGTVTSPILFIIFMYMIPMLFDLNKDNDTYSAAFVDDFIFLVAGKHPERTKGVNGIREKM